MPSLRTGTNVAIAERERSTRNQKVPKPINRPPQNYKELFVQQANSEMPDDGENFPPTILWGRRFDIFAVLCHWKDFSGTFECKLNIGGSDISGTTFKNTDFSESSLKGLVFTSPVPYKSTDEITVKVVNSSGLEEWEAIFMMRQTF